MPIFTRIEEIKDYFWLGKSNPTKKHRKFVIIKMGYFLDLGSLLKRGINQRKVIWTFRG